MLKETLGQNDTHSTVNLLFECYGCPVNLSPFLSGQSLATYVKQTVCFCNVGKKSLVVRMVHGFLSGEFFQLVVQVG